MSYLDQQGHDVLIQGRKGLAEGHQARQGGHEKRVTLGLGQNCQGEENGEGKINYYKIQPRTAVAFTIAMRHLDKTAFSPEKPFWLSQQ